MKTKGNAQWSNIPHSRGHQICCEKREEPWHLEDQGKHEVKKGDKMDMIRVNQALWCTGKDQEE